MTQLISIITMSLNLNAAPVAAQFQTCVYPNTCAEAVEVLDVQNDFEICVMPRTCSGKNGETPAVEIFAEDGDKPVTICLFPNPCGANGAAASSEPGEVTAQFTTCQYPNTCSGVAGIEENI